MILISKINENLGGRPLLIKGNKYYGQIAVTMYNKNTFKPACHIYCYIITCETGSTHKFSRESFEDLGEYRKKRLKDLLS